MLLVLGILVSLPSVASRSALSTTVSTDKAQYSPGESVSISGVVMDNQSNPVFGASVSIQVDDPGNNVVHVQLLSSDQSGSYVDPMSLPTNTPQGKYTIYASASKPGYVNGQNQAQFLVIAQTTSTSTSEASSTTALTSTTPTTSTITASSTTSSSSQTTSSQTTSASSSSTTTVSPPQCLIATATYGSAVAPEVTLLRNFRDSEVLHTSAGDSFMMVFNAFYYSFSPSVASFIATHDIVREGMKIVLYPLIGILYVSSTAFKSFPFNEEIAVTFAGIIASCGIGTVYLGPGLAVITRIFRSNSKLQYSRANRISVTFAIASLIGLLLAELTQITFLLEVTTATVVLSSIALGGLLPSWILARSRKRPRR